MRSETVLFKRGVTGLFAGLLVAGCGAGDIDHASGRPEPARMFEMPYLMRELDNGLRVIIVPTGYPDIVTLQVPVQTGSRNEVEPGKSGFAHFFEHMMFRGTPTYPADAYATILKKAGANTNAFTTDDYTNYYVTFTKPDLEKMIEVEADRFRNLAYSESDFRTEALAVKGEYLKNYSDPVQKAFERARALSFDVHPYRHTTMGFIEDIDRMPEQFDYSREFLHRWYRPEYTSVIVAGDVDPEATFELVRKYWGRWERGDYVADIPAEPAGQGPRYEHVRWEAGTQPWLFVGFRSPAFVPGEKDYPAMMVIDSAFFSDSSELYRDLVLDRQYADQILTDFPMNADPNLNLVYIRLTDEAHFAEVEAAVLGTLATARSELIAPERLAEIKSRLRFTFAGTLDNTHSIGSMLASFVPYGRTPETVNACYAAFQELTAEDVRSMADRYFTDRTRVTVTVSNAAGVAGVGRELSLDALAAKQAPATAEVAVGKADGAAKKEEVFGSSGEDVPLAVVARPSKTSALIDVSIIVHAGAAMDPAGKKGLAALTAAMLTDAGSATWTIDEINTALYPIASSFDAQVDKEMTRLSGQVHRDNLDTWYRYVRSQLLNPGWRQQDFERVKTQLNNALRTGLVANNDEELGKEMLYSSIYGGAHPYGTPNLGLSRDIAGLTLDDVRDFYARYYTIRNLTVGISGGYPQAFLARLSADLQSLPAGERAEVAVPVVADAGRSRVTIVEKETPAVAVSFGFPIDLKRGDPDWLALWLARSWLGEHRSQSGQLFKRIREARGMNYGDYAYVEYFPGGMFSMQPGTNLGRQQQIFQVWIRPVRSNNDAQFATRAAVFELQKLIGEGMSETDFEATREFLAKFASQLTDSQSRQLGYALDSQYYGIGDFASYVRDGLDKLTLADVNRVIRENLRTEDMNYVFVTRDAEDLRERLGDELPSPMSYDAEKPESLLEEDAHIATIDLGIRESDITVIPAENVFE